METRVITEEQLTAIRALKLPERKENNPYLLAHFYGDNICAPSTFSVKIYTSKKGLKAVCNDFFTLDSLLSGKQERGEWGRIVSIDDSGWGCPLGGVLVGVHDSLTGNLYCEEILPVFFQGRKFDGKEYLREYAMQGIKIVESLGIDKQDTLIRICTGFVNVSLKEALRTQGYNVEVGEIKEPLQSWLENAHRNYIRKEYGYDGYYDPKELKPGEIVGKYEKMVAFIKEHSLWQSAKTGWPAMKLLAKST